MSKGVYFKSAERIVMADNFFQEPEQQPEAPEPIKLGDKTYSQEELNHLVELGSRAGEIEKTHGPLDKVVSEFGRRAEEVGKYRKEIDELKKKYEAPQPQSGELTEEQRLMARVQLEKLIGGKPLTAEELNTQLDQWYTTRRSAEKLLEKCDDYQKEISGEDGRPKFVTEQILNHMQETGIRDPLKAYKDKFEPELEKWKSGELNKSKATGFVTQEPTGLTPKQPRDVKVTKENLSQLVSEAIYGATQE